MNRGNEGEERKEDSTCDLGNKADYHLEFVDKGQVKIGHTSVHRIFLQTTHFKHCVMVQLLPH